MGLVLAIQGYSASPSVAGLVPLPIRWQAQANNMLIIAGEEKTDATWTYHFLIL
jgi:hypothetical protein